MRELCKSNIAIMQNEIVFLIVKAILIDAIDVWAVHMMLDMKQVGQNFQSNVLIA